MAAVSCLPSHGSSSDVSCCPPLKGMDSDDRSSSSHGSIKTEVSRSTGGDPGCLVQRVSDLMVFGCRPSSVLPLEEAKDARSFCSGVDDAAVLPKGNDRVTSSSSCSVPVLKDSSSVDASLFGASGDPLSSADGRSTSSLISPGASDALNGSASLTFRPFSGAFRGLKTFFSAPMRFIRSGSCCSSTSFSNHVAKDSVSLSSSSRRGRRCSSSRSSSLNRFSLMSFFWICLPFFFTLVIGAQSAITYCFILPQKPSRKDFQDCRSAPIMLQVENKKYPDADFSDFTQDEFNDVMVCKSGSGLSSPGRKEFTGNFVTKESQLQNITFVFTVMQDGISQSFTLKNNLNLTTVDLAPALIFNPTVKDKNVTILFTVTGNKRLSQASITLLKQLNYISDDSVIQDFGECDGSNVTTSFTDLEGCHYIAGDLIFSQDTTNADLDQKNFPSTLTEVKGCIVIQNTSITNVDFIRRLAQLKTNCPTKNVVRYNKNLCIYSEKKRYLDINVRQFIFEDNSDCEDVCTWNWALANRRNPFVQCAVIQGDVNINGSQFGKEYEMLYTVKMIMGQLMIHENSFENFTIFKKLLKVDSTDSTKPAIHIFDNPNMKLLELPVLREITRPASDVPLLVVEDNHEDLQFSKRQHTRLGKLGKIEIPVGEPVTTTMATTTRVRATTSSSSRSSLVCHASLWMFIYVLLR